MRCHEIRQDESGATRDSVRVEAGLGEQCGRRGVVGRRTVDEPAVAAENHG